ncbi:MAG: energy transducer TonB [Syntrophaceae bacterium]|nr:energy transducer TonB [Syntrophaceae bacterium]
MKTLWTILSVRKSYTFIASISIHLLAFFIPVSLVITPQIHEMELFVSIEDIRVLPKSIKPQMAIKKPQLEPVKEMIKPIEPSYPKIQNPEIVEQVKEVRKEPVEETKEEPIKIESKPISQLATEDKEAFLVSTVPSTTEGKIGGPIKEGSVAIKLDLETQPPISDHVAGSDTGHPIETSFGASVAPAFLHREMPVYPMMARKLGREGKVVLKLTIDETGNLLDVEVMERAGYGFTEAAVEAVKKSTFLPAKKDGKPIASRALLPIKFRLERN